MREPWLHDNECMKCGSEIPELRLKALPHVKTCVQCSETSRVAGFPIVSGKSTYSGLQLGKQRKNYMKNKTAKEGLQKA